MQRQFKYDLSHHSDKNKDILGKRHGKYYYIDDQYSNIHKLIISGPVSPASSSYILRNDIKQRIARGENIVLFSNTEDIYASQLEYLQEAGYNIACIDTRPINMNRTASYNPFDCLSMSSSSLAARAYQLSSYCLFGSMALDYYETIEAKILSSIILYIKYIKSKNPTIEDISDYISNIRIEGIKKYFDSFYECSQMHDGIIQEAYKIYENICESLSLDVSPYHNTKENIEASGILDRMGYVCSRISYMAKMGAATLQNGIDMQEFITEKSFICVITPYNSADAQSYESFVLKSMLFARALIKNTKESYPPTTYIIEDASNIFWPEEIFSIAGADDSLSFDIQYPSVKEIYRKNFKPGDRTLHLSHFDAKILLRAEDEETVQYFSNLLNVKPSKIREKTPNDLYCKLNGTEKGVKLKKIKIG